MKTMAILAAVASGKRPVIPGSVDARFASLIARCWHADPAARPTAADLVRELSSLLCALLRPALTALIPSRNNESRGMGPFEFEGEIGYPASSTNSIHYTAPLADLVPSAPEWLRDIGPVVGEVCAVLRCEYKSTQHLMRCQSVAASPTLISSPFSVSFYPHPVLSPFTPLFQLRTAPLFLTPHSSRT